MFCKYFDIFLVVRKVIENIKKSLKVQKYNSAPPSTMEFLISGELFTDPPKQQKYEIGKNKQITHSKALEELKFHGRVKAIYTKGKYGCMASHKKQIFV